MQKFAKLFVLALCLTLVGSVWAGKTAKGPLGAYLKNGRVDPSAMSVNNSFTLPEVGSRRPGSLDEVIISEDFDAVTPGDLPDGWTQVDVDGGTCSHPSWPYGETEWSVLTGTGFPAHSGANMVANAFNDAALPNNDWLILPQQNLTGAITLTYWAASQDPLYLETFEVRVSTAGNLPADFTNLISSHVNVPNDYAEYTDDLSEYAGAPFYIAYHYTSVDEFIIKVDDVLLEAGAGAPTGTIAGTVTEAGSGNPIEGAAVEIEGGQTTTTDASGEYSFTVPAGTYTLDAYADGYEDATMAGVDVIVDQTTTVDFEMTESSTATTDYPSAATPVDIPDNNDAGAAKNLTITDDFLIEDVDVTVNITHTYISDLDLYLVSPWEDSVQLAEDPVTFPVGANMTNCRFDDEAETPFDYETLTAPFTGSWQPFAPLSAFDGFTTAGVWRLRAVDNEDLDTGTIGVFTIHVTHEASAVDDGGAGIPTGYALHQAFPNPFNPSTQISFEVPVTTNAEMKIFNSLGQDVATLFNGQVVAGSHTLYFMADNLPSGLYFAQLRAGNFVSTQKLVLMK